MEKVLVKWLKCPRHKYGIPRAAGVSCFIPADLAKKIKEESPGDFEILEEPKKEQPVKVKDTMAYKPRTRPVKREKKD